MKTQSGFLKFLAAAGFSLFSSLSFASGPMWTITPFDPVNIAVPQDTVLCFAYLVTNQSTVTHNLQMLPQNGVAAINQPQNTGGICDDIMLPTCDLVFSLNYQESCVMYVTMRMLPAIGNIIGGPTVCEQGNSLQCYSPNPVDQLYVVIED